MITLTGVTPAAGSTRNSKNSLVEFTLLDENNSGINTSTLIVEISGQRAVEGATFSPGFSGIYSEINVDLNTLNVIINKETEYKEDSILNIKIQIQDYSDKYYNFDYSFKVVTSKPFIFESSPKEKDILVSPQKLYFDIRSDISTINLLSLVVELNGAPVYSSGSFVSPFAGGQSSALIGVDGLELTIDPEEFLRNGVYSLKLQISDVLGNKLIEIIKFTVAYTGVVLPPVFPQGGFVGFYQGVKKVVDVGNGSDIEIEWSVPASRFYNSDVNSLIYFSTDRLGFFRFL